MEQEKAIEIIQKLLRLRDGTNSQAEAESAAAKVHEMLFKYNLEMADIHAAVPKEESQVGQEMFTPDQRKNESSWVTTLYGNVSKYNFCRIIMWDDFSERRFKKFRIAVIGRKANVEVVNYTCEWLMPRIREMAQSAWKGYTGWEKRGTFTRGFLSGAAVGIGQRLYDEWITLQHGSENSRALVLVTGKEVDDYISNAYGKLRSGRSSSLGSYDGRTQGIAAGRSMEIRRGVGTCDTARQLKGG